MWDSADDYGDSTFLLDKDIEWQKISWYFCSGKSWTQI